MVRDISYLLSTRAIRERSREIYALALNGQTHFSVDENELEPLADFVIEIMKEHYPDLQVPYHSRWRHLYADNGSLVKRFERRIAGQDVLEQGRLRLSMILVSVLVDAGAGPDWVYQASNGRRIGRSEGLALAGLEMVLSGTLGENSGTLVSAEGLKALSADDFERYFQVSAENPLMGVAGRVGLLNSLGDVLASNPAIFPNQRPGDLIDYWISKWGRQLSARNVFDTVIECFGNIWPGREFIKGVNLGDTWRYRSLGKQADMYVPFHKLSQWLTYSMIETLELSGFTVSDLHELTGLAEYRNGGLFVDGKVLILRDQNLVRTSHHPSDPIIIEWRALTVVLLDEIADIIRDKLGLTTAAFPLARVLEGGTWMAGRRLAAAARQDSSPPLNIRSDGTVF